MSYWRKYVHEVLGNRFGGPSLPRKSVVRLTDCPDMTLDVYYGRKTTTQQQLVLCAVTYQTFYKNAFFEITQLITEMYSREEGFDQRKLIKNARIC